MNWPSALISTARGLYLLRSDKSLELVRSEDAPYFGITWSTDNIFVCCDYGSGTHAKILTLDRDLNVVREVRTPIRYPHQILWLYGKLHVTMTEANAIGIVRLDDGAVAQSLHTNGLIYHGDDTGGIGEDHVNSLWESEDGDFWICEHRQSKRFGRPSRFRKWNFGYEVFERCIEIGSCAHNVYVVNDHLYFCNSAEWEFCRFDLEEMTIGKYVKLDGFTRGLAAVAGGFLVGVSYDCPREERTEGPGKVYLLDKEMVVADCIEIQNCGGVNGVRALGVVDYAHNRIVMEVGR